MSLLKRKKKPVKKQWCYIRIVTCDSGFQVRAHDYSTRSQAEYVFCFETFGAVLEKLTELKEQGLRIET